MAGWHYGPCGGAGGALPLVIVGVGIYEAMHSKSFVAALDDLILTAAISIGTLAVLAVVGMAFVLRREFARHRAYRPPAVIRAEAVTITDQAARPVTARRADQLGQAGPRAIAPARPGCADHARPRARCRNKPIR